MITSLSGWSKKVVSSKNDLWKQDMKNKKFKLILILLFITIITTKFLYSHYAEKNLYKDVRGEILISFPDNNGNSGIYIVPLDPQNRAMQFYSQFYEYYAFPFMQDNKFFCVGYKGEQRESAMLMVEGGLPSKKETTVLMKTNGTMIFPVITADLNTVYYVRKIFEDKRGYKYNLCKYDRYAQKEDVLVDDRIDANSKILLCADGSIIYTEMVPCAPESSGLSDIKYSIVQLLLDGEKKILVEDASSQVWLLENKRILFCGKNKKTTFFTEIYQYDLESKEITFVCNQHWRYSPTISPDKKHLIFANAAEYGGLRFYLTSIDGKGAKEIPQLRNFNSQPFWWK